MKPKCGYKPNKQQQTDRIKRVMKMMGDGLYNYEIVSILMKEWECSDRSVNKYIRIVRDISAKEITKQDLDDYNRKYDHLYQIAMEKGDYKLAQLVLSNKAKYQLGDRLDVTSGGSKLEPVVINIIRSNGL